MGKGVGLGLGAVGRPAEECGKESESHRETLGKES